MNSHQLGRATLALCLGSIAVFLNLYATQPLLPMLANEFLLSEVEAAYSLTIATLMLGVSLLVYGPLSDAIGRKIIMTASLIGMTASSLAISYAENFEQLLLLRAIHGFFLGGIPATAVAYIGEEFPKTKITAVIGLYISANSIGGISSRLVAGFIGDLWDWQTMFITIGMFNLLMTVFFVYTLPNSTAFIPQRLHINSTLRHLYHHLCNTRLLVAYAIGGCHFMIVLTMYTYVIFVLADAPFHLSSSWLGLLFLTYGSGTVGSALIGFIDKKVTCAQRIALGTVLIICGCFFILNGSLATIISGLLINTLGFFIAHSSLSLWVNQHAIGSKASASSLYLVFYYAGASAGTLYLNPFWEMAGLTGVVLAAVGTMLVVLVGGMWLYKQEKAHTLITA